MSSAPIPLRLVDPSQGDPQSEQRPPMTDAQLFKRFAPYVARIGLRLLGRESDVDDLIQEVFLAAFKQRE